MSDINNIPPPSSINLQSGNPSPQQNQIFNAPDQLLKLPFGTQFTGTIINANNSGGNFSSYSINTNAGTFDIISTLPLQAGSKLTLQVVNIAGNPQAALIGINGKAVAQVERDFNPKIIVDQQNLKQALLEQNPANPKQPVGELTSSKKNNDQLLFYFVARPAPNKDTSKNALDTNLKPNSLITKESPNLVGKQLLGFFASKDIPTLQKTILGSQLLLSRYNQASSGDTTQPTSKQPSPNSPSTASSTTSSPVNPTTTVNSQNLQKISGLNIVIKQFQLPDQTAPQKNQIMGQNTQTSEQKSNNTATTTTPNSTTTSNQQNSNTPANPATTDAKNSFSNLLVNGTKNPLASTELLRGTVTDSFAGKTIISTPVGILHSESIELPKASQLLLEISGFVQNQSTPLTDSHTTAVKQQPIIDLLKNVGLLASNNDTNRFESNSKLAQEIIPTAGQQNFLSNLVMMNQFAKTNDMGMLLAHIMGISTYRFSEKEAIIDKVKQLSDSFKQTKAINSVNGWQTLSLPLLDSQSELHSIQLFIREPYTKQQGEDHQNQSGESPSNETRFMVELHVEPMGEMQLDGLYHIIHDRSTNHLDLIIRSQYPMEADYQQGIIELYSNFMEISGMSGSLKIEQQFPFYFSPLKNNASDSGYKMPDMQV